MITVSDPAKLPRRGPQPRPGRPVITERDIRKASNEIAHAIRLDRGPPGWSELADNEQPVYGDCAGCRAEHRRLFRYHWREPHPHHPARYYICSTWPKAFCVVCVFEQMRTGRRPGRRT